MLAILSCVVTGYVAVRMRPSVAGVVTGRGKRVELDGFRVEQCRTVAERADTRVLGACAAIAGKGCYGSGFVLGDTAGNFYASAWLGFESASRSSSEGGEWYPEVFAKVLWLTSRCWGCNA